jgi:hypothetical protein
MGDYDALGGAIDFLIVSFIIMIPLAIWKLIDIIIWLVHFCSQHIQIT